MIWRPGPTVYNAYILTVMRLFVTNHAAHNKEIKVSHFGKRKAK